MEDVKKDYTIFKLKYKLKIKEGSKNRKHGSDIKYLTLKNVCQ